MAGCPVCGSADSRDLRELRDHESGEAFRLGSCARCQARFLLNPPSPEAIHRYYETSTGDRMVKEPGRIFVALQRISFYRELKPLLTRLNPGATILDLGAGDGAVCGFLRDRGFRPMAVDFRAAADWPERSVPYRQVNLNDASLPASAFLVDGKPASAIILRHSLEHLYHPRRVLEAAREAGVRFAMITVPNSDSWLGRLLGGAWYYWDPPRHLSFFDFASLGRLAEKGGYRVSFQRALGLDELVSSAYRQLKLAGMQGAWVERWLQPKGLLGAVSSSVSAFLLNSVCQVLLERRE